MSIDKENVIRILSETIGMDIARFSEIKMNDDLRDCGLDSIRSIDVIVALENEFDIAIEDEDLLIDNFNTIEKMIKLIEKYINLKELG